MRTAECSLSSPNVYLANNDNNNKSSNNNETRKNIRQKTPRKKNSHLIFPWKNSRVTRGGKERKKGGKKNPPFPFYPPNHFSFGGTSVVFLPDSHFARQQYTSSRRFDAVFRRIDTGEGAVFCPSSPIYSPAIRFHPTRREGRQKCIFRERFAVIGSHHPRENVRFLNVIRPESVAVFVFAHR